MSTQRSYTSMTGSGQVEFGGSIDTRMRSGYGKTPSIGPQGNVTTIGKNVGIDARLHWG